MQGSTTGTQQKWQARDPELDDLRLQLEPKDEGEAEMFFDDINGNRIRVGTLTRRGAMRLIGRIAHVANLDVTIKRG